MLWFEIKEVGVFGGFSRFFEEFVGYLAQCGDLFLGDNVINRDIAVSVVGVDFDPMLAKVIAHGPSRSEAAGHLALSLERTHLGGMHTNRDFLVAVLRTPEFLAGDTTTDFIERVDPPRALELTTEEREERDRRCEEDLKKENYNRIYNMVGGSRCRSSSG